MDEADRMIDMGFEEDVRTIFSFFQVSISLNVYKHHLKHCDVIVYISGQVALVGAFLFRGLERNPF